MRSLHQATNLPGRITTRIGCLIKSGYIDLWMMSSAPYLGVGGVPFHDKPERAIALDLYMWVQGRGREFKYLGIISHEGADFGAEMLFATAKADLYFDEAASKSKERRWALGIGIAAAIVASALTYLAEKFA